jgi:hypothetical protein
VSQFHPGARWLVAQNDPDDMFNPSLWSRFDWAYDDAGALWFCQSSFNSPDENAAARVPAADATSPSTAGCGGASPWTKLSDTAPVELAGSWTDTYGSTHVVSDTAWVMTYAGASPETFTVTQVHDRARWLVAQNSATAMFNASKWSRFDWTYDAAGSAWFCQAAFDAADEAAAAAASTANRANLSTDGCGGFPWSALSP